MRKLSKQNLNHMKVRAKQGMKDKIRKNLKKQQRSLEDRVIEASGKKQEILFEKFQYKQKKMNLFFDGLERNFKIKLRKDPPKPDNEIGMDVLLEDEIHDYSRDYSVVENENK